MATLLASNAIPLAQLTAAAAAITASYTVVGKFSDGVDMAIIISTLDQPVQLSFDGTTDTIAVPAGNTVPVFMELNFKANLMVFPRSAIFVKEIGNPTTGNLYICGFKAAIP